MKPNIFKDKKLDFLELIYLDEVTPCTKNHTHEELTFFAIKEGCVNIVFNETIKINLRYEN